MLLSHGRTCHKHVIRSALALNVNDELKLFARVDKYILNKYNAKGFDTVIVWTAIDNYTVSRSNISRSHNAGLTSWMCEETGEAGRIRDFVPQHAQ
eukprot:9982188-Heterocapsa_arctica.AAC.1